MAVTIKLKNASGSDPSASDLVVGELAIRTSNCKLFSKNDGGSAVGIVAGSADTLTTARTIAGVSFDGSANISLNNNAITNGAGYLADIVSDTSPQLGGDLDTNGHEILLDDNHSIKFGAGEDLQLIHNSSSQVNRIDSSNQNLEIRRIGSAVEDMAKFIADGGVELYHNGTKKAETVAAGFTVSGTLEATGLTLSGSVGAAITAASDGSTITLDLGANTHQSVTLGGNRTFAAPSNQTVGQSGSIFITQDGTGSRTASFNSAFKFVGGTAPTLSTAANAVDRIDYIIKSSNVIHCAVSLDVK
tara:strand:+ start:217 stop:1125 length:909 start_codon:yes stop_codon:yes gene_type:complete